MIIHVSNMVAMGLTGFEFGVTRYAISRSKCRDEAQEEACALLALRRCAVGHINDRYSTRAAIED